MTRVAIAFAAMCLIAAPAYAQEKPCKVQAAEHKPNPLAGAALQSFMKKCESDANAACEKDSADKKLAGAAKASHMKKCVADKVGS